MRSVAQAEIGEDVERTPPGFSDGQPAHEAPNGDAVKAGKLEDRRWPLERAHEPEPCPVGGREPAKIPAREGHSPAIWHIDPGQHVDERALTRTVRADEPDDATLLDPKAHIGQRAHRAEGLRHAPDFEERAH